MKNRLFWGLIAAMVLLMGISTGASAATTPDRPGFTAADSEFYLDDQLYFFFRPGLVLTITDYEIPSDLKPLVTFTLTDPGGLPLDMYGVYTPGVIGPRFFISYIPVGEEQIVNYNVGSRGPTNDSGGEFTTIEMGTYTYKYGNAIPADYEQDATHYIVAAAYRDLRPFELDRYASNDLVTFVPDGSSEPMPRDVVDTSACNRCHDPIAMHGGRYLEVPVCEQCHNPGLEAGGYSYSFNAMIHRVHSNNEPEFADEHITYPAILNDCSVCHTGGIPTEDLPLVANPNPAPACGANGLSQTTLSWNDQGQIEIHLDSATGKLYGASNGAGSSTTGKWVTDGMGFVMVDKATGDVIEDLPVYNTVFGCAGNAPGTYRGTAATQWDHFASRPARAVCGGCHANIDFATGENSNPDGQNHPVQTSDDNCTICHKAYTGNEWDASVTGAHTVPYKSNQLAGVLLEFVSVTNAGPGKQPLVTFSIADKFGPINPNSLNRLRFSLSGPNTDFDFYVQEDALGKAIPSGKNWTYLFTAKLPKEATGSYSVGAEGRMTEALDPGPCDEAPCSYNAQMTDIIYAFAVTDETAEERRVVVDDYKCESCHANLELHGGGRNNATAYCQTCHQPFATDEEERAAGDPNEESIHFKYMIHKLHRGEHLENGYIVAGHNNSLADFGEVLFPGDLRNCETCHITSDLDARPAILPTFTLPLPEGVLPTHSPDTLISPFMQPITASCLSCHDSDDAAAHADANTSVNLGESCNACHSEGKTFSVTRVHAR
jgi:hypothetical protein